MHTEIPFWTSVIYLIAALIVLAIIGYVYEKISGKRNNKKYAEQNDFAARWKTASQARTQIGLDPAEYDINALDNYHQEQPKGSEGDAMRRLIKRGVGEPFWNSKE